MNSDPALIGVVVALTIAITELVKWIIHRRSGKVTSALSTDEHKALMETREMTMVLKAQHAPVDTDGIPLWYMPRSWAAMQGEMAKELTKVANAQVRLADTLDRIESRNSK